MSALAPQVRDRLARPVVLLYWLILGLGLGLYSYEVGNSLPLWIGTITGTVLGHTLALRDLRLWFVAVMIAGIVYLGVMFAPEGIRGPELWLAFVPAALCAYASLSDRWSLAAVWFPAVIWMLTILDRTQGTTTVDTFGAVLLGGVALAFVLFLRARETRRVGLWARVSAQPLAVTKQAQVLRDLPSTGMFRLVWTLGITAFTFAATAWLAPKLWKLESARHHELIAHAQPGHGGVAVPCCPLHDDVEVTRTRVREYLDLGRGREDREPTGSVHPDCRICPNGGDAYAYGWGPHAYPTQLGTPDVGGDDGLPVAGSGPWVGGGPTYTPPQHITRDPYSYPHGEDTPITPIAPAPQVTPPPVAPRYEPQAPVTPRPVTPTPPRPTYQPTYHPPTPAPAASPAPAVQPPAAEPSAVPPRADVPAPPGSLHWLLLLLTGAVIFQLTSVALRPLRRSLTLRHLRSPLWPETVDQRVSNSWQLALIGLRDAGFRPGAAESPLDLAKRVKIDELATCATILERTRYGIQIDDGDLDAMASAADATYNAARARISPAARAAAALRWPLA